MAEEEKKEQGVIPEMPKYLRKCCEYFNKFLNDAQVKIFTDKLVWKNPVDLSSGVDELIKSRKAVPSAFPTLEEILEAVKQAEKTRIQNLPAPKSGCGKCRDGMIAGFIESKKGFVTSVTFRCDECQQWRGKLGESIPLWGYQWQDKGYRVEGHIEVRPNEVEINNEDVFETI